MPKVLTFVELRSSVTSKYYIKKKQEAFATKTAILCLQKFYFKHYCTFYRPCYVLKIFLKFKTQIKKSFITKRFSENASDALIVKVD